MLTCRFRQRGVSAEAIQEAQLSSAPDLLFLRSTTSFGLLLRSRGSLCHTVKELWPRACDGGIRHAAPDQPMVSPHARDLMIVMEPILRAHRLSYQSHACQIYQINRQGRSSVHICASYRTEHRTSWRGLGSNLLEKSEWTLNLPGSEGGAH